MSWITAANSHIGSREEQQDRYLVAHSDDGSSHLLVIADGAGGHKTGALAAQTAIDCVSQNLPSLWSSKEPEIFLKQLILLCNKRVLTVGGNEMACTTLVIGLIKGDEIFWGHVGDSRFYLIRNQEVVVKTTDHSVVELQRQQAAENAEAVSNASSSELYMCLGALENIIPEVSSSLAREGDTLLLCSDGLWGQLDMQPLIAELSGQALTSETLSVWSERANTSKLETSDNITLVAARFMNKPTLAFSRLFSPFNAIKRLLKK